MHKKSIFIFRRDLRIQDNVALYHALKESITVIPIFIFEPLQVEDINQYKSNNAVQFMIESLQDLQVQLKEKNGLLQLFYGHTNTVLENIFTETKNIQAVYVNRDYTPFSTARDTKIKKLCKQYTIAFHSYEDLLLNSPENIVNKQGNAFRVFTPFFKHCSTIKVAPTKQIKYQNFYKKKLSTAVNNDVYKKVLPTDNKHIHVHGGRTVAKKILSSIEHLKNYQKIKDFPALQTSNLSAHIKFGTVSIREVYHTFVKKLGPKNSITRQLYWRDFFTHVAYNNPYVFKKPYQEKYSRFCRQNFNEAILTSQQNVKRP